MTHPTELLSTLRAVDVAVCKQRLSDGSWCRAEFFVDGVHRELLQHFAGLPDADPSTEVVGDKAWDQVKFELDQSVLVVRAAVRPATQLERDRLKATGADSAWMPLRGRTL
jgi:hypothetical protein